MEACIHPLGRHQGERTAANALVFLKKMREEARRYDRMAVWEYILLESAAGENGFTWRWFRIHVAYNDRFEDFKRRDKKRL